MGKLPDRLKIASWYRGLYQKMEPLVWLPKINPSFYQVIAIILSFTFLMSVSKELRFFMLLLIVLLDWLDGATARRYGLSGDEGYMIDVFIDRFSELIIFFPINGGSLPIVCFALALINLGLSFISYKTEKHTILPLRFAFLFYLWI